MTAEKINKIRGTLKVGINTHTVKRPAHLKSRILTHKPAYGKADPCGGGGSD